MKLTHAFAIVATLLVAGCDTAPVSRQCMDDKPLADTYMYACEDGTARCTFASGATRYVDCQLGAVYCVEECRSSK